MKVTTMQSWRREGEQSGVQGKRERGGVNEKKT
jgi:hypothetical protein